MTSAEPAGFPQAEDLTSAGMLVPSGRSGEGCWKREGRRSPGSSSLLASLQTAPRRKALTWGCCSLHGGAWQDKSGRVNAHLQDLKGFIQSLRERWRQQQTRSTFRNFPPQIGALKLQLAEKSSLKVSEGLCSPPLFFPYKYQGNVFGFHCNKHIQEA